MTICQGVRMSDRLEPGFPGTRPARHHAPEEHLLRVDAAPETATAASCILLRDGGMPLAATPHGHCTSLTHTVTPTLTLAITFNLALALILAAYSEPAFVRVQRALYQVESLLTMPWLELRVSLPSLRASHSQNRTPCSAPPDANDWFSACSSEGVELRASDRVGG